MKIRILHDKEILTKTEDKLEYSYYANNLKEIIISSGTPLNIGVFAEWGAGKTSLMRLVKNLLDDENKNELKTIWFDAWQYDKIYDLRIALINNILKEIHKNSPRSLFLKFKIKKLLRRINWYGLGNSAIPIALSAINPIAGAASFFSKKPFEDKFVKEEKKIELIGEFKKEYEYIINHFVPETGKFIIFIDDLDRCLPETAIDILEAIKVFLNIPRTMFVIGADSDVIEKIIIKKYGTENETWCRNYLDKVIQFEFKIPRLSNKQICREYLQSLSTDEDVKKELARNIILFGNNPRKIKNIVNKINYKLLIAQNLNYELKPSTLIRLLAIEEEWYELFKIICLEYDENETQENYLSQTLYFIKRYLTLKDEKEKESEIISRPDLEVFLKSSKFKWFIKKCDLSGVNLRKYIYINMIGDLVTSNVVENGDINLKWDELLDKQADFYEKGKYEEAIEIGNQIDEPYDQIHLVNYNSGLSYLQIKQFERAIDHFTKCITDSRGSRYANAYIQRAYCYKSMANIETDISKKDKYLQLALSDHDKSIEFEKQNFLNYYDRGLTCYDYSVFLGDIAKDKKDEEKIIEYLHNAIKDNDIVIEKDSNYGNAYINRGLSYSKLKIYNKAMTDYSIALKLGSNPDLTIKNMKYMLNEIINSNIKLTGEWDTQGFIESITNSSINDEDKQSIIKLILSIKNRKNAKPPVKKEKKTPVK